MQEKANPQLEMEQEKTPLISTDQEHMKSGDEFYQPRFRENYEFARMLVLDDNKAWEKLMLSLQKKAHMFIEHRYPGMFSNEDKDDILSKLRVRLLENDRKALRVYRGMQTLSAHIEQQLVWTIQTELRERTIKFLESDDDIDCVDSGQHTERHDFQETSQYESEIPSCIKELPDKERFSFLLRYYDDFGFPYDESILLAKSLNKEPAVISRLINELLEPTGHDMLAQKKRKRSARTDSVERLQTKIYFLTLEEQRLEKIIDEDPTRGASIFLIREKFEEIRRERNKAEQKIRGAKDKKTRQVVGTPYKIIGQILEEDPDTIRYRLFKITEKLAALMAEKKKQNATKQRQYR